MIKILANDGIDPAGKKIFESAGFDVSTDKVEQDKLAAALTGFDAVLVRSATQVRREHIDGNGKLRLIGRAGVGIATIFHCASHPAWRGSRASCARTTRRQRDQLLRTASCPLPSRSETRRQSSSSL